MKFLNLFPLSFFYFFLLIPSSIFAQKNNKTFSIGLSFNSEYTYNNEATNNSNPAIGLSAMFQWKGFATESSLYFAEREFTDSEYYVLGNPRFPVPIPLFFDQVFLEKSLTLEQTIKYENFKSPYLKNYFGLGVFTKLAQKVEMARTTATTVIGPPIFTVSQLDIEKESTVPGIGILFFTEVESASIYHFSFGAQVGVRIFQNHSSVNSKLIYRLEETILKGRNANHAFFKFKVAYHFD